jgi:menaquinone-dependent protoporphyrinogen oxidase
VDSVAVPPNLSLGRFDAAIVAGSLHQGKHQVTLARFVRDHAAELSGMPTAFLSVSLTAVIEDPEHRAEAKKCMDGFYDDTGWRPTVETPVAGALLYTKYDFFKRFIMRMIAKKEGGDTDSTQDYEYTDWGKLRKIVGEFLTLHAQTLVKA